MTFNFRVPTDEELKQLNMYEFLAEKKLPISIKRIYKLQGWSAKTLSNKIQGVSQNIWWQYGQATYDRKRMIHILAALSWASQASMSSFYCGNELNKLWPDVDSHTIACIVYSSMLPSVSFKSWVLLMMELNLIIDTRVKTLIEDKLNTLSNYSNDQFMMPEQIHIDDFKEDYYQSIAVGFRNFRVSKGISIETMAYVLNITVDKYMRFEDATDPISIPATIGLRLKLGFQLTETFELVDNMKIFKPFSRARRIQEKREQLVIELISAIPQKHRALAEEFSRKTADYCAGTRFKMVV